jgi:hypothetical protein
MVDVLSTPWLLASRPRFRIDDLPTQQESTESFRQPRFPEASKRFSKSELVALGFGPIPNPTDRIQAMFFLAVDEEVR